MLLRSTLASLTLAFVTTFSYAGSGVPTSAEKVCPIKIGQSIPSLSLQDVKGKPYNLNKAIAAKPTVLIFYRGSWCPYCNTHLGELKTIEADLQALGYQIIAVSPDLPKNLESSVKKNALEYTLVSDTKATAAKALGLAFTVDTKTYNMLLNYDIDLEAASGETHHILPTPAALVLDTHGKVRFSFVSPDYKVRVEPSVLLAAAKAAVKK